MLKGQIAPGDAHPYLGLFDGKNSALIGGFFVFLKDIQKARSKAGLAKRSCLLGVAYCVLFRADRIHERDQFRSERHTLGMFTISQRQYANSAVHMILIVERDIASHISRSINNADIVTYNVNRILLMIERTVVLFFAQGNQCSLVELHHPVGIHAPLRLLALEG